MTINIKKLADLAKFFPFLRVGTPSKFSIPPELTEEVIRQVLEWAKKNDISVRFVSPSGQKIASYTALGAAAGMFAGCLALPYGPIVGAIIGALGGYALAHVSIEISPAVKGGAALFTIL